MSSLSKGFSIFELMISVTIMVIISTIIVSNQSTYSTGAALKNVANDLSLSLRQAQIYGISVRVLSPGSESETFNVGYGVSFDIDEAPSGDDKAFIFFADRDGDRIYDGGRDCSVVDIECLDETSLGTGNYISDLCVIQSGVEDCDIESLDITFRRPAIEAVISYDGGSTGVSGARVELSSADGKTNSLLVYTTGQISIE